MFGRTISWICARIAAEPVMRNDQLQYAHVHTQCERTFVSRPELTKWPFTTHKRTYQERYAAFWKASAWVRSGLNPSMFSDRLCSTPQT